MDQNPYIAGSTSPQQPSGTPITMANLQAEHISLSQPNGYQTIPNAQAHSPGVSQMPNSPPARPQSTNMNQNSYIAGLMSPQQTSGAPITMVNSQHVSPSYLNSHQAMPNVQVHNPGVSQVPNSPPATPQIANSQQYGFPQVEALGANVNVSQHPQLHPRSYSESSIPGQSHPTGQVYVQAGPANPQQSQVQFQSSYQQSNSTMPTLPEGSIVQQDQVVWVPIPGTNPQQYQQYQLIDPSALMRTESAPGPSGRIEARHLQQINPMPWIKRNWNGKYLKKVGNVAAVVGNEIVVIGTLGLSNPMRDYANYSNARVNRKKFTAQLQPIQQTTQNNTTAPQNAQQQAQPMVNSNQHVPVQQQQPQMPPPNQQNTFQQQTYGQPQQVPGQQPTPQPTAQTTWVHPQYAQQPSQQTQFQYQQPTNVQQAYTNTSGGPTQPGLPQPNQQPQVQYQYMKAQTGPASSVHAQSGQFAPGFQQGLPQINQNKVPIQQNSQTAVQGAPQLNRQVGSISRKAVGTSQRAWPAVRSTTASTGPELLQNATVPNTTQAPGPVLNSPSTPASDTPSQSANSQDNSLTVSTNLQNNAAQQQFQQDGSASVQIPQVVPQQQSQMQDNNPANIQEADSQEMSPPSTPHMQDTAPTSPPEPTSPGSASPPSMPSTLQQQQPQIQNTAPLNPPTSLPGAVSPPSTPLIQQQQQPQMQSTTPSSPPMSPQEPSPPGVTSPSMPLTLQQQQQQQPQIQYTAPMSPQEATSPVLSPQSIQLMVQQQQQRQQQPGPQVQSPVPMGLPGAGPQGMGSPSMPTNPPPMQQQQQQPQGYQVPNPTPMNFQGAGFPGVNSPSMPTFPQQQQQQWSQMQNPAPMNFQGAGLQGMGYPSMPPMQQDQTSIAQQMALKANKMQILESGVQILGVVGTLGVQGDELFRSHNNDQQDQGITHSLTNSMANLSLGNDSNNSVNVNNQFLGGNQDSSSNFNDQNQYASNQDPNAQYNTSQNQDPGLIQGTGDSSGCGFTDTSDSNITAGYSSPYASTNVSSVCYPDSSSLVSYNSSTTSPDMAYVYPDQMTQYMDTSSQYGYFGAADQSQASYDNAADVCGQNYALASTTLQVEGDMQASDIQASEIY